MSLWQGVKGARVELAAIADPLRKLRRIASISKIFASEIIGTISLAPFAARASALYRSLPPLDNYDPSGAHPVYLVKDVKYDTAAPRNTIDLYIPTEAAAARQAAPEGQLNGKVPVVVFVHGGVWAAGEKWHYAPLANCLARLGVLACVVSYTLYPDALVPQIVQEVSAAFDWAMTNVEQYGGDKQQVSLVGHSAGAQLYMMALLQRAKAIHEILHSSQQPPATVTSKHQIDLPAMPKQFVAITGVYDIAKHYAYEEQRGVHELSTMKRAMGGFEGFAAMSPAVILGAALQPQYVSDKQQPHVHVQQEAEHHSSSNVQQQQQRQELTAVNINNSFQLSGESIARRIGFERGSAHHVAAEAALQLQSTAGMGDIMHFPLDAAAHLPPTVLMSSCTDVTVPWYESAEMYYKLLDAGVPVKHLVYNKVGHGDFVVDWPTKFMTAPSYTDDWGSPAATAAAEEDTGQHNHVQHTADSSSAVADCNSSCSKIVTDPAHDHRLDSSGDWGTGFTATGISSQTKQVGQFAPLQAHQQRQLLLQDLPPYCRDLAIVVLGRQRIQFVHRQRHPVSKSAVQQDPTAGNSTVGATDSVVSASPSLVQQLGPAAEYKQ